MYLPAYSPEQIPSHIDECMLFSDFRPTVIALAVSDVFGEPEYVLVKSVHEDDDVWWPVQGGLGYGETPNLATARELKEEIDLQVCPDWVSVIAGMDYPTRIRDEFTRGKFIIATTVGYNSMIAGLKHNPQEISNLRTVSKPEFRHVMIWNKVNRPETSRKADFLLDIVSSS